MGHARNHRLRILAEKSAKADEFGGNRLDASFYELQLIELKNDKSLLSKVKSDKSKALAKANLIPKYLPYVEGVIAADKKVDDEIVTTIMLWCFDAAHFKAGLNIAEFALKYGLEMPDSFSRDTPSIVAEEIANAALENIKLKKPVDLDVLLKAHELTKDFDMHDQIQAKLFCAIGRVYNSQENHALAVQFMKEALSKNPHVGCKQECDKAEKLITTQSEDNKKPENQNGSSTDKLSDDQSQKSS